MQSVLTFFALAWPATAVVIESLGAIPNGWKESEQAFPGSTPVQLHVALKYQNLDQLESELASVSTPGSPRYGQYQDVNVSTFSPSSESSSKVKDWLSGHNASSIQAHGDMISFLMTIERANSLLDTTFKLYSKGASTKLRTMQYSVPDDLAEHVDLVSPTTYFGDLTPQAALPPATSTSQERPTKRQARAPCFQSSGVSRSGYHYDTFSPECIRELYNTTTYTPDPKSGSTIAFANFLNQTPSHSDLKLFESRFNIPAQDFATLAILNGGVDDQDPQTEQDGEANLDVQEIVNVAAGLPISSYITGGLAPAYPDLLAPNASLFENEPYLQFFDYLLAQPNANLPYVISISYGDHENTVPNQYAARVCNQIGMLGLRGRSILSATGDEGVGAVCRDNRPPGNLYGKPQFTSAFPASCPYITAVGGTQFQYPEEAWNATGGGFSRYFATAWYQKEAVQTYLTEHISPSVKDYYSSNDYVNFSGRGYPDISAHSLYPWYLTYINGTLGPNGGTSAATPVVSAIVALLNDARLRAGKPVMGFLNPWLYGAASGSLNDITLGGSKGCNGFDLQSISVPEPIDGAGIIPYAGFNATPGWDPATGYGTPDFLKLKYSALEVLGWKGVPGNIWQWPPNGGWYRGAGSGTWTGNERTIR